LTPRVASRTVSGVTAVELIDLTKSFGGRRVLDMLRCAVDPGEFFVLLGPSGCGKTTTLRLIAGLEQPDSGEIRLGGRSARALSPGDRGVGMVFQSSALYPHMTVGENLAFPLRTRGVRGAAATRALLRTAELLELEALLERRADQLSGGERQRAALGRAIVGSPPLLLLDEPFASLDPPLRAALRTRLRVLHESLGAAGTATTTIHVTHDQEEALAMADRIAVMRGGRIEQSGTPRELYLRPATRFVAEFVGSPPMNFLAGTLDDGELFLGRADSTLDAAGVATGKPALLRMGVSVRERRCGPVLVGIRPEHIAVVPPPQVTEVANVVRGTVRAAVFLGSSLDVWVDVPSLTRDVREGCGECLRVRAPAALDLRPGLAIALRLPPEHLHVFWSNGRSNGRSNGGASGREAQSDRDAGRRLV